MSDTHLNAEAAQSTALRVLSRFWPDWKGALIPLKPLSKPLRATPFRVTGGPVPAVIKVWGPGNLAKATAQADRQRDVAGFLGKAPHRAPAVLDYDPSQCALLMQDTCGDPLDAVLDSAAADDADAILTKVGGWIAALHTPSRQSQPFRPKGHIAWLDKLANQVRTGARTPPDAQGFSTAASQIASDGLALRGKPSTRAITHKDLTPGNLMVDRAGTIWGIDFENAAMDEPLRDLFSVSAALMALSPHGTRRAAITALFSGYGDLQTNPDVARFLFRAFALGLWARTPAEPSRRQAQLWAAAQEILNSPDALPDRV